MANSWLKRLSSKQEIANLILTGALNLPFCEHVLKIKCSTNVQDFLIDLRLRTTKMP